MSETDKNLKKRMMARFKSVSGFNLPKSETETIRAYYVREKERIVGCVVFGTDRNGVNCRGVSIVSRDEPAVCKKWGQKLAYERWRTASRTGMSSIRSIDCCSSGIFFKSALMDEDLFKANRMFTPWVFYAAHVEFTDFEKSILSKQNKKEIDNGSISLQCGD